MIFTLNDLLNIHILHSIVIVVKRIYSEYWAPLCLTLAKDYTYNVTLGNKVTWHTVQLVIHVTIITYMTEVFLPVHHTYDLISYTIILSHIQWSHLCFKNHKLFCNIRCIIFLAIICEMAICFTKKNYIIRIFWSSSNFAQFCTVQSRWVSVPGIHSSWNIII